MSTNVSARAASLRSQPGYVQPTQGPVTQQMQYPSLPTLPALPPLNDARSPGFATRGLISKQLGSLPERYNPLLTNVQAGAKAALAGYGGWSFAQDDPNTPQREDLQLQFDPSAGPGEREKQAVRGVRNQANAAGMLFSSFAQQNMAAVRQELSLEAQRIAMQYSAQLNDVFRQQFQETNTLVTDWARLYGSDATWLAQNPLPPPPDPVQTFVDTRQKSADGFPIIGTYKQYPNLDVLRARYPGQPLGVRRMGSGGYVVVAGPGGAERPERMP